MHETRRYHGVWPSSNTVRVLALDVIAKQLRTETCFRKPCYRFVLLRRSGFAVYGSYIAGALEESVMNIYIFYSCQKMVKLTREQRKVHHVVRD